jgi:plastocyanin
MTPRTAAVIALAIASFASLPASSEEIQVRELNRGPNGLFVFDPELVRKPGDTVAFIATDRGTRSIRSRHDPGRCASS